MPAALIARLYEPLLGSVVRGLRRAGLDLAPSSPDMAVLDVGCGTGAHLSLYADAGCRVVGVDTSSAMLAEARRRLGAGASLVCADAARLPFASGTFDLVLAATLLHAVPEYGRGAALAELARVAGNRGRILVIDHDPGPACGLGGRVARVLGVMLEALSGHLAGYRSFRAAGGVPGLAQDLGLAIERRSSAAGSTFGIYLLRA